MYWSRFWISFYGDANRFHQITDSVIVVDNFLFDAYFLWYTNSGKR